MSSSSSCPSTPREESVGADDQEDGNKNDFDIETITQQANMTIVIHPGSSHLRVGRASDPQPVMIPHVIAWRHKRPGEQKDHRMKLLRQQQQYPSNHLQTLDKLLSHCSGRTTGASKDVCKENKKNKPIELEEQCGWTWTDTSHHPPFLIGDDALYIDETDCYDLFWPIINGQLNLSSKSLTAVLADLEALWTKTVENFLGIPSKEFENYRCILIIPDIYIRTHVKHLVDVLLLQMNFKSIILHQESVCATYGCGIANACVVDVGHHKTSVCCVEDGYSHPDTRICFDVGGCDVTGVFAWLLKRNNFPYRSCNTEDRMDSLLLEELKETFCHLDMKRSRPEAQEFNLRRPGRKSLLYPITIGDEALQAPLSLFAPKIYGMSEESTHVHLFTSNPGDISDPFDEIYLTSTRTKQEEAWANKREKAAAAARSDETNGAAEEFQLTRENLAIGKPKPHHVMETDAAIVWSIERCPASYEDELKRRMYSCILVVGGGLANFTGMEEFLKKRVVDHVTTISPRLANQVQIITKPKGQDPSMVSWKGGTVLSSLENAQELWIGRDEWRRHGLRLLRESCPFIW